MSEQIVHGLSFEDHQHADGWAGRMSASTLLHGMVSMLELRAALDGAFAEDDTPAKRFGRAYHCRLLEPVRFRDAYAVRPDFEPRDGKPKTGGWHNTKDYKEQCAAWDAEHASIEPLKDADAATLETMAAVVKAHPVVQLLRTKGGAEVSIRG